MPNDIHSTQMGTLVFLPELLRRMLPWDTMFLGGSFGAQNVLWSLFH